MARTARLRILAALIVTLLTACASANVHPSQTAGSQTASSPTASSPTADSPTAINPTVAASPVSSPSSTLTRNASTGLTKTVYLTFDDGPNPTWTPEILSLLEKSGAHASFFVIGRSAAKWPLLVEREATDGDTVGDHTWTHPDLTKLSAAAVSAQLATDKSLITQLTGTVPALWRPPYEAFDPSVVAIASGLRMKMELWSDTTGDWQLPGTEVIVLRVMAGLHNGTVVLFHDGGGNRSETVAAVATLIPQLQAAGYRLAALPAQGIGW